MKIVLNRDEFHQQLESAKREAMKGFGDDTVSSLARDLRRKLSS